jgi:hypothetical protein
MLRASVQFQPCALQSEAGAHSQLHYLSRVSCLILISSMGSQVVFLFSWIAFVLWLGLLHGDLGVALESPDQKTR